MFNYFRPGLLGYCDAQDSCGAHQFFAINQWPSSPYHKSNFNFDQHSDLNICETALGRRESIFNTQKIMEMPARKSKLKIQRPHQYFSSQSERKWDCERS